MNLEEFEQVLKELDWTHDDFCRMAEVNKNMLGRWKKGVTAIPEWVRGFLTTARDIKNLSGMIDANSSGRQSVR